MFILCGYLRGSRVGTSASTWVVRRRAARLVSHARRDRAGGVLLLRPHAELRRLLPLRQGLRRGEDGQLPRAAGQLPGVLAARRRHRGRHGAGVRRVAHRPGRDGQPNRQRDRNRVGRLDLLDRHHRHQHRRQLHLARIRLLQRQPAEDQLADGRHDRRRRIGAPHAVEPVRQPGGHPLHTRDARRLHRPAVRRPDRRLLPRQQAEDRRRRPVHHVEDRELLVQERLQPGRRGGNRRRRRPGHGASPARRHRVRHGGGIAVQLVHRLRRGLRPVLRAGHARSVANVGAAPRRGGHAGRRGERVSAVTDLDTRRRPDIPQLERRAVRFSRESSVCSVGPPRPASRQRVRPAATVREVHGQRVARDAESAVRGVEQARRRRADRGRRRRPAGPQGVPGHRRRPRRARRLDRRSTRRPALSQCPAVAGVPAR